MSLSATYTGCGQKFEVYEVIISLKLLKFVITEYIDMSEQEDITKIVFILVCRSCIVKHLEENTHCPKCEKVIHHSHPMNYLRYVH